MMSLAVMRYSRETFGPVVLIINVSQGFTSLTSVTVRVRIRVKAKCIYNMAY